jgi:hypothetical protein
VRRQDRAQRLAAHESLASQTAVEQSGGHEGQVVPEQAQGVMSGLAFLLPVPDGRGEIRLKCLAGQAASLAGCQQVINRNPQAELDQRLGQQRMELLQLLDSVIRAVPVQDFREIDDLQSLCGRQGGGGGRPGMMGVGVQVFQRVVGSQEVSTELDLCNREEARRVPKRSRVTGEMKI